MKGHPMFTIGEYANRAMVYAYRDMRSAGIIPNGPLAGTALTIAQNDDLHMFVTVEVSRMADRTAGFNYAMVPHIVSLAYAIAQTEQYPLGSDRYCAWREYELHLHGVAIAVNKNR